MEEVLKQFISLLQARSRRVFSFFKKNSSENAYEVFRQSRPTSRYTHYAVVSNNSEAYVVIRTRKYNPEKDDYYHAVFVIGVDDTLKLFCHRLPWHEEFEYNDFLENLTYQDILRYLGIQKHIYEDGFRPAHGVIYRVQGDIAMQVFYFDLQQILSLLRDKIINHRINNFRYALKRFIRKIIVDNRDENAVNEEIKRLSYLRKKERITAYILSLIQNLPQKYRSMLDPLELKAVYDKYRQSRRKMWFIHNHLDAFIAAISEIIFEKLNKPTLSYSATLRLLSQNLNSNEKIYNINIGSHRIKLIGIRVNDLLSELRELLRALTQSQIFEGSFLLIRPQSISFSHDEHRHISVSIEFDEASQVALVNLRTLNTHRMQVRRR